MIRTSPRRQAFWNRISQNNHEDVDNGHCGQAGVSGFHINVELKCRIIIISYGMIDDTLDAFEITVSGVYMQTDIFH